MPIAVLDCRTPRDALAELERRGFEPLLLPPHPALPAPVASHPDLLLFFTSRAVYTVASYQRLAARELSILCARTGLELCVVEEELGDAYPQHVLLDAAPLGSLLFCHPKYTARELTHSLGYRVVPVRQGYAKCSTVPVGETALLTADPSIASAAQAHGVDVLLIRPGFVSLPGYNHGFLGGAASFSPNETRRELFFCGELAAHPDAEAITHFCRRHQTEPISLGHLPLTDVGTLFLF